MYGDKMEKIRFQICEKELTLYPAQGENRPLIVFQYGDGRRGRACAGAAGDGCAGLQSAGGRKASVVSRYDAVELSAAVEAGSGCYGRSGCLSGDIGVGNRAGSQEKKSGEARRTLASPGTRWLGFLRSMRCTAATASRGWPACPAPCGFRSSGNTCFGMN